MPALGTENFHTEVHFTKWGTTLDIVGFQLDDHSNTLTHDVATKWTKVGIVATTSGRVCSGVATEWGRACRWLATNRRIFCSGVATRWEHLPAPDNQIEKCLQPNGK